VGSLKGVDTMVGMAVAGTTLGGTAASSPPVQATTKATVRTAAMAIPVLDPHSLLLSKAISLFYGPALAFSETQSAYKIGHDANPLYWLRHHDNFGASVRYHRWPDATATPETWCWMDSASVGALPRALSENIRSISASQVIRLQRKGVLVGLQPWRATSSGRHPKTN